MTTTEVALGKTGFHSVNIMFNAAIMAMRTLVPESPHLTLF